MTPHGRPVDKGDPPPDASSCIVSDALVQHDALKSDQADRGAAGFKTLDWMLEAVTSHRDQAPGGASTVPPAPAATRVQPFEDVLLPIATAARLQRQHLYGVSSDIATEEALVGLDQILISRLSRLLAPALFTGFALHRLMAEPHALLHGLPVEHDASSTYLYDSFTAELRQGRLEAVFQEYPVLAQLCAKVTELWIDATGEFLQRLSDDAEAIARNLLTNASSEQVVLIEGGLSDPHCGGRTVLKVTFASGQEVGYKPRDLSIDSAWRDFLGWLDASDAPASARAPKVLKRDGYGWVEWIASRPCTDKAGAVRFFERAGSTLCLLHLLRGTDFHFENVIAAGDWPTPVDLETLFQPVPRGDTAAEPVGTAADLAGNWLRDSVLSTGFLPRWLVIPGGHFLAVGGLYQDEHRLSMHRTFTHVNTDAMDYEPKSVQPPVSDNIVTVGRVSLSASDYVQEILRGYERMYRFIVKRRDAFLSSGGPLERFQGKHVRVVLRPTALYALLIHRAVGARNLRDLAAFQKAFEFLADHGGFAQDRIVADEAAAMACLDIPYFKSKTNSTALTFSNGDKIENFFHSSAVHDVAERTAQMSNDHLSEALRMIEAALSMQYRTGNRSEGAADKRLQYAEIATPQRAVRDIFERLEKSALQGSDGTTWIGAVPLALGSTSQIDAVGFDLYSGTAGIALFFAAYCKTYGDERGRAAAMSALAPLRAAVHDPARRKRLVETIGIGGASGAGSIIYALTRAASLLDDASLNDEAAIVAEEIASEQIEADRIFDVIGGSAGAILGLLALHQVTGDAGLLVRARACGKHLLRHRISTDTGFRAWAGVSERPLTGMSHGASGIALALHRLTSACHELAFAEAAQEALDYEDALFSNDVGNWPDLRNEGAASGDFACQWCHGAPGIALVRSELRTARDRPLHQEIIDAALDTTRSAGATGADHLCCGVFGRIEVLLTCGLRLQRAELVDQARILSQTTLQNASMLGDFAWPQGNGAFAPGFFCGRSGIGYQLLRLENPNEVPSILAWD